jgi:RHS repeat-associated protein
MPSSPSAPSVIRPLGYNTLNRLTNLTTQKAATTIQSYAFTLGPTGNRTQIAEAGKTKTYTYDDLYRLTGETLSGGTVYSKVFGYDPVGNRQTQTTTGTAGAIVTPGTINYGYDTRDRLLAENATTYGYDANGNLTTQSGFGTYTFDTENRLVQIAKQDGTLIEHAYDADGTRIRTKTTPATGPPQITNFLVDTSGGLSHVVAESDAAGAQTAYYLRALDDLLAVIRPTATPGVFTTRYYHADGIGSIRKLTDETGAVTDSYEYTAFGEQYEHVGTDPQPYSFAGEPLDPNTGFQYHRARWLQPSTGRFAGMDPWRGSPYEPQSLHRYLYSSVDPVGRVDPSGRDDLGSTLTALQVNVTIALSNFSARLAVAFGAGGSVLGRLFNEIGRYAEVVAEDVLLAYQRFSPALEYITNKRAGSSVIDFFLKFGERTAWLEIKYGLPSKAGSALTRLGNQIQAAAAAGEGEVILWSLREPTAAQLRLVGAEVAGTGVRIISGVQALSNWLISFLLPV